MLLPLPPRECLLYLCVEPVVVGCRVIPSASILCVLLSAQVIEALDADDTRIAHVAVILESLFDLAAHTTVRIPPVTPLTHIHGILMDERCVLVFVAVCAWYWSD